MLNDSGNLPSTDDPRLKQRARRGSLPQFNIQHSTFSIPIIFIALFFLYPMAAILRLSFADGLSGLMAVLADGYTWRVLGFSAGQAALSTLLTLAAGLPGAYVFARYEFPGKALLRALAGVPFVMPTVVVAAALGALLGPRGLVNTGLQTLLGLAGPPIRIPNGLGLVLLAHVFYNYTVVLRMVGGFWANLDPRLEQAAALLGASRRRALWEVTLPLLAPAIGAAALLVFIFSFTSFGVVVILGGPRMATLEVEIYRQTAQLLRLDVAATLALLQAACTLAMSLAYTRLAARSAVPLDQLPRSAVARRPRGAGQRLLLEANALLILLLLGAPLAALALRSLIGPDGLGLGYYLALGENRSGSAFFVPPTVALANSLRIAAATAAIALTVGVPAAYMLAAPARGQGTGDRAQSNSVPCPLSPVPFLDALFMLPLGTSAVTLGLGYLVALSTPALAGLRSSPWLIPLAHSLVAMPFVIRSLLPTLRGRRPRLGEAAALLGAGPWRAWLYVELPLIAPAIITGAVFAFTVSLGEFGASLLLARPDAPTLPVMIFRYLGQPGAVNYGQAMAMSSLLMLTTALSFLALERIRPPGGEF
ncbi:iron ABC transporter permease [Chloroflexales bacterium ZM16-3]|nr:iron ABC transporter permease [Chloroflexales bacterium ZM16-3]